MATHFQHQQPVQDNGFSRTARSPKHGQTSPTAPVGVPEPRSFTPRPAH